MNHNILDDNFIANNSDSFTYKITGKRNWLAIIILLIGLCGWMVLGLVGACAAAFGLIILIGIIKDFDFKLVMIFFLAYTLLLVLLFLWAPAARFLIRLFSKTWRKQENIFINNGELTLNYLNASKRSNFSVHKVKNLRLTENSLGLEFDFESDTIVFATLIQNEQDAVDLLNEMNDFMDE